MRVPAVSRSQVVAALLLPLILPLLGMLYVIVIPLQGRPFLFASERMRDADASFNLYKIRTMRMGRSGQETVYGGHQRERVTRIGHLLRRFRLDELPQIFNVLRGDINFIGPRPPLRAHVNAAPGEFRRVLGLMRPGITGLSTVMVHRREERLMSRCGSAREADEVYFRLCLPVKLRLDMIYAERQTLALDAMILWRTVSRLLPAPRTRSGSAQSIRRVKRQETPAELPLAA